MRDDFQPNLLRTTGVLLLLGGIFACSVVSRPPPATGAANVSKSWLTVEDIERASHSPSVLVRDTVSSQGGLSNQTQRVTVTDLVPTTATPATD